jgi:hypothetical protein
VTGSVLKSFQKYLEDIPDKHYSAELEKTAIARTARILRKILTQQLI